MFIIYYCIYIKAYQQFIIINMPETEKKHLSLVVCGHVDAGKSTTTGHLIFKLGGVSDREMEKLQAEADAQSKSSFAFAYYIKNS